MKDHWKGIVIISFFVTLALVCYGSAEAAGWSGAASMTQGHYGATATLLPNGKVLLVGGCGESDDGGTMWPSERVELYDPSTNTWSRIESMWSQRAYHTATLLPNGKVLIVGGWGADYWWAGQQPTYLRSVEIYDPHTDKWSKGMHMSEVRMLHTATLLPNGKVLVAGGLSSTAEIYDLFEEFWTSAGNMSVAREAHTATLLPNGKVLVAGGIVTPYQIASAELYDYVTNTWSSVGNMSVARGEHTATLLPNGKVLVAGGYGGDALSSAELYDYITNTWSGAGSMSEGRVVHTATLLPNGKVLVAGGGNYSPNYDVLSSAELYDYVTNTWSSAGSMSVGRYGASATLLPNGRVLVAGGSPAPSISSIYISSVDIYDSSLNTWSSGADMSAARWHHTSTLLPNGKVLTAGGYDGSSALSGAQSYDDTANTWSPASSMNTARYFHTATLLPNGKVLAAGGHDNSLIISSAELYNPSLNSWASAGNMNVAREEHTATLLPSGKVLVAGGYDGSVVASSAEVYDPSLNTWSPVAGMSARRWYHTATLLPNGKVLVAGGYDSSVVVSSAEVYDPSADTWSNTANTMSTARAAHTATLLPNGKVLVAGGWDSSSVAASGADIYDPSTNSWSPAANMGTARAVHTATLFSDGTVLVTGGYNSSLNAVSSAEIYNPATNLWSYTAADMSATRQGHTAALLPSGRVLIAGGEDRFHTYLSSTDIFNVGLGFNDAWRPVVTSYTSPLVLTNTLSATGSGFRGYGFAEGSGGATNNSATNYPLVQLRSISSSQQRWLALCFFTNTSYSSLDVPDFPAGPALLTFFVNGIPGVSKYIEVKKADQTALTLNAGSPLTYDVTETLSTSGGSGTGAVTYQLTSGSCTLAGDQLKATSGTGSCSVTVTKAEDAIYNAATATATVTLQRAGQTISVISPAPASATYNSSFTVSATGGGSGLPVVISGSNGCSGTGDNSAFITMTSGTTACTVLYSQAGDDNYAAAEVTETVTAQKAATSTSLTANVVYSVTTAEVTLTATVSSAAGTPTGTVTFTAAGYGAVCSSVAVISGVATCTTNSLAPNIYDITATYSGDGNYLGSLSDPVSVSTFLGKMSRHSWYLSPEGWVLRAYTNPLAPSEVYLEVMDMSGNVVDASFIWGMTGNPMLLASDAAVPEVSLGFDKVARTAHVIYTSRSGRQVVNVTGIKAGPPQMGVTPNPLAFGIVRVWNNLNKSLQVSNTGILPLHILSIGTPGVPFSITAGGTCAVGVPVAAGGSCSIEVKFAPTMVMAYSSSFLISSDGGNVTVYLNGTGGR